jgi:hypothetical protein
VVPLVAMTFGVESTSDLVFCLRASTFMLMS